MHSVRAVRFPATARCVERDHADHAGRRGCAEHGDLGRREVARVPKCLARDEQRHREPDPRERARARELGPRVRGGLLGHAQPHRQRGGRRDAERNRVYAEAFNKDPEFFGFYRSMQAYEAALQAGDTRMLLSPDSEFFRYFNNEGGQRPASAKPGEHPTTPAEPKPAPEAASPPSPDPRAALGESGEESQTTATGEAAPQMPPAQ